jgi:hypothetical protein
MPIEPDELCQELPAALPDATGFSEPVPMKHFSEYPNLIDSPGGTFAPNGKSLRSWVIWLKDDRYSYAWGETQEEAWGNWLKGFGEAVIRIIPAGDYKSALPIGHYLREMNGQV